VTAFDDGAASWIDENLFQRATSLDRVLVTCDDDFLAIADRWLRDGRTHAGLVFQSQRTLRVGRTIADLELIARVYEPSDIRDRVEYLPF
jgi:hypothetical protein